MSASSHDLARPFDASEPAREAAKDTRLAAIALRKVPPPPGGLVEKVRSHGHSAADDDDLDFPDPAPIDSTQPLVDPLAEIGPVSQDLATSPAPVGRRTDWSDQLREAAEKVAQRRTLLWFVLFLCVAGLAAMELYWQ